MHQADKIRHLDKVALAEIEHPCFTAVNEKFGRYRPSLYYAWTALYRLARLDLIPVDVMIESSVSGLSVDHGLNDGRQCTYAHTWCANRATRNLSFVNDVAAREARSASNLRRKRLSLCCILHFVDQRERGRAVEPRLDRRRCRKPRCVAALGTLLVFFRAFLQLLSWCQSIASIPCRLSGKDI